MVNWCQARRQDLAIGGAKNQIEGPKSRRGAHFQNTVLDVCSNRGTRHEMGGTRGESKPERRSGKIIIAGTAFRLEFLVGWYQRRSQGGAEGAQAPPLEIRIFMVIS